ncbi:hypothetical protein V1478_012603 [Vespula squamosa]|uniref:Uncharacterized protein n=1 Tax=Vespula squamosa TaxID=30214 RepID=A0ABD2ADM6_VESSQ
MRLLVKKRRGDDEMNRTRHSVMRQRISKFLKLPKNRIASKIVGHEGSRSQAASPQAAKLRARTAAVSAVTLSEARHTATSYSFNYVADTGNINLVAVSTAAAKASERSQASD